jgi:hypothetical protein
VCVFAQVHADVCLYATVLVPKHVLGLLVLGAMIFDAITWRYMATAVSCAWLCVCCGVCR